MQNIAFVPHSSPVNPSAHVQFNFRSRSLQDSIHVAPLRQGSDAQQPLAKCREVVTEVDRTTSVLGQKEFVMDKRFTEMLGGDITALVRRMTRVSDWCIGPVGPVIFVWHSLPVYLSVQVQLTFLRRSSQSSLQTPLLKQG